jgi:dephospho-CoA kinase
LSKWAGKYVIGLTGNIGAGKSVVRRMLEHLGAYGIDADALAHRAISKGAPGYPAVIEQFGKYILAADGQIDRARLGRLVFADPEALARLEAIIHPLVIQALDYLVRRASQPVVVIEAIKLLEAKVDKSCDAVWVVTIPTEVAVARLVLRKTLSSEEARKRLANQTPVEEMIKVAKVVIQNTDTFEDTWRKVTDAWRKTVPVGMEEAAPAPDGRKPEAGGLLRVVRGRPRDSEAIAALINRVRGGTPRVTSSDIMAAFGEKGFLMLKAGDELRGVIGWQVENLVARTTDFILDKGMALDRAVPALLEEMERASRDLQCEASLIFVEPSMVRHEGLWRGLGYVRTNPLALEAQAWQDAAHESMPEGSVLLFKKLREDRILRPI